MQNAKGGLLGRKIELLIEDTAGNPADLRAQGAGDGRARRLPPLHRHHAVVRGARRRAEARRVERDLHLLRQRRRPPDRRVLRAELLPRQHLRARWARARSRSTCARPSSRTSTRIGMDYAWGHNSVGVFEDEMKRAKKNFVGAVFSPDRHQGLLHLHHQDPPVRRRRLLLVMQGDDNNAFLSQARAVPAARQGAAADRDRRSGSIRAVGDARSG